MYEKINWTLNDQVVKGPNISVSKSITVDAYDKVGVAVAAGVTKEVEIQPASVEGLVQFLLINSDQPSDDLTYQVKKEGEGEPEEPVSHKLDAQHLLIGDGAVGLLGASSPETLSFTNDGGQDANIEILVG